MTFELTHGTKRMEDSGSIQLFILRRVFCAGIDVAKRKYPLEVFDGNCHRPHLDIQVFLSVESPFMVTFTTGSNFFEITQLNSTRDRFIFLNLLLHKEPFTNCYRNRQYL